MKRTPLKRKTPLRAKRQSRWRPEVEGAAFWSVLRKAVLQRDNYACIRCGVGAAEVHHSEHLGMGASRYDPTDKRNDPDNLVSLCAACHREEHREGAAARGE